MAILNFLKKKKKESPSPVETFTPKVAPARGPGGKFVSKKKVVIKKEIDERKVEGPFMAPFAGKEIRKFYANGKWYFSVEDLLFLLNANPPIKPLEQLKGEKSFEKVLENRIKTINEVDCADYKGTVEILKDIIKIHSADFPGSLFRWLEDISTHEPETVKEDIGPELHETSVNPSDRGVSIN